MRKHQAVRRTYEQTFSSNWVRTRANGTCPCEQFVEVEFLLLQKRNEVQGLRTANNPRDDPDFRQTKKTAFKAVFLIIDLKINFYSAISF